VYVGDELDVDAAGAVAAGLVGVWLDRPGPRRVVVDEAEAVATGVVVVHSLAELPEALDAVGVATPLDTKGWAET
jgi:putative hydrolase of the HAD superfamily